MNRKRRRNHGFSILELMVVVLIMGILAAIVTRNVLQNVDKAKVTKTRIHISQLKDAINQYKLDTNIYPDYLEDLVIQPANVAGWTEPYIEAIPLDGWGNEFVYFPPERGSRNFEIISYGADGEQGGTLYDADISNLTMLEESSAIEN